ncbi:GNAT family N-acetyltransferase [Paenibacillus naphthalenovorans]|uniref:Acetyltransferase n=1 Tax=Paenibacillus naphthalenovorans TaxID=162209 RepID=A0A0U2WEB5_9BACL|nr:GNAT family N-acetyltransferase [Paenibacillus naphthalenovorans]ALS24734.1 acetyltransferase [Paenibacillus naphthalenovorans]GCL73936.1 N-acetyltransferase [Paenibacillus naphthalenovorans]SDJ06950.1 Protein N-acetyltransferase, RimJ/RimL family [Paenibacillus naphthalenovorans]
MLYINSIHPKGEAEKKVIPNEPRIFYIAPLTEAHCRDICSWVYPPPYHTYHFRPWELMLSDQEEFADAEIRVNQYRAVLDASGELSGFVQFFPMVGVTRLGLGMRPDLCGCGNGIHFVRAIVQEAQRLAPQNQIDLEVMTWNERAIRVYTRAGFIITDTYQRMTPTGMEEFHCMVWSA